MATHVGRIVLYINGVPRAEAKTISTRNMTGKDLIKGMSPFGLPVGNHDGTPTYEITGTFYLSKTLPSPRWETFEDGVLIITPRDGNGPIQTYFGVFCKDFGDDFDEEKAAERKVTLGALARTEVNT